MSDQTLQSTTMSAILELSRLVCSTLDLDEVFSRVLTGIRDLSGADTVSIMMRDASGCQLQIVAGLGVSPERYTSMRLRIGEGLAGWVVQHGQPIHIVNPGTDPRFLSSPGVSYSVLFVVPLHGRTGVLGALNLSRFDLAEEFSPEIAQTVEIFASHAAIAIENAMAAAGLRYATVRERIAGLVVQAPRTSGAALPVVEGILNELSLALEASTCALMQQAEGDGSWRATVAWPILEPAAELHWQPTDEAPAYSARGDAQRSTASVKIEQLEAAWLLVRSPHRGRIERLSGDAEQELIRFAADQIGQLLATERLIADEQRSRALSKTLSQLAAASNAMIGQNQVLDFILSQLTSFISYDSAGVFIYHDERYARMVAGHGFRAATTGVVLYMGPGSLTWELHHTHQVLYVPDVQQIPGWQNVPDSDIIRSWIGVPLLVNDELIGVLTIDKWLPNAFNTEDVQVAQMFGEHMAVAIQNARLLAEARSQAGQIQVLHQLSLRIATIREVEPLLDALGRLLYETFGYYQVLIGVLEGDELVMKTAYGRVNQVAGGEARRHSIDQGIAGWVIRHGQTALVNNVQEDPLYAVHSQLTETAAELVVPIKTGEKVLGVIAIESETTGAFGRSDVQLAEALAGQAAVALENILRYEELRRTQEHLLHSERLRALGELSSGVAHDFNNLLASILGHTQLLLVEDLKEAQLEELRVIERAALDGAATVRRLQSFAQTNLATPIELADINMIVEESLAITRPRWRNALQNLGLDLTIERDLGRLPMIRGDSVALRELVTNLILNALDAMPRGGVLRLRTALVPAPPSGQTMVLLEVSDTGMGMPPEVQKRIFDPFFSTKGTRGTGMGLAMVYSTVQRHQGNISVRSVVGQGSTFTLLLPVGQVESVGEGAPPQLTNGASAPSRILVVEDDPAVRRVLVQLLRRQGHEVDVAASGAEALASMDGQRYDLLCSDLGMPGMSGWDLISRVRAAYPKLRTLLITGWGEQISPDEARSRGVDQVLAKPFDSHRLRQVISSLLTEGE